MIWINVTFERYKWWEKIYWCTMMWQTMLLEEIFSHSTFLLWLLCLNSINILALLDAITAYLLHYLVCTIKLRSIECIDKVFIDREKILILLIYCCSTCCLTFKWWIKWFIHRCLKWYQWFPVCCLWELFFWQLVGVFIRYHILRSPILIFCIVHNTRNRYFLFYCMYQSILQLQFISYL